MQARELIARLFFATSGTFQATVRPGRLPRLPLAHPDHRLLQRPARPARSAPVSRSPRSTATGHRPPAHLRRRHPVVDGHVARNNSHFITADGNAAVAYQVKSGTAIGLGDPVGGPDSVARAVLACSHRPLRAHGWAPCLFSSTGRCAAGGRALGWRHVQVAEDTLIDLPGPAVQRQVLAGRAHGAEPGGQAGHHVPHGARWPRSRGRWSRRCAPSPRSGSATRRCPRWASPSGGVDEALDPTSGSASPSTPRGSVHGVTSWLPVYGAGGAVRGWTLDVMRRRQDGFRPVVEFLIASALPRVPGAGRRSSCRSPARRWPARRATRPRPRSTACSTPSARRWSRSTGSGRCTRSRPSSSPATSRCTWSSATRPTCPGSASPSPGRTCRTPGCATTPRC